MKSFLIYIRGALTALCLVSGILAGATDKKAAMPFILNSLSPRAAAMGGVRNSLSADGYANFGNVSAVPFSDERFAFDLSYGNWQPEVSNVGIGMIGAAYNLGERFGITLGIMEGMNPKYGILDEDGQPAGTYKPYDLTAGAGFAYRFAERFSAGLTVNYAMSAVAPDTKRLSSVYADLQVAYSSGPFLAALSAGGIGTSVKDASGNGYNLPTNVALGGAYRQVFGKHGVEAGLDARYFLGGPSAFSCGVGVEYVYSTFVAVRAGYHHGSGENGLPSFASAGLGFRFRMFKIDASYILAGSSSPLRNTFSVGLGYSF